MDYSSTIPKGYCPHWPPPEHLPYHVRRVDQQALDALLRIEGQLKTLLEIAAVLTAPHEDAPPPAKQNSTGNSSAGPKRGKGK